MAALPIGARTKCLLHERGTRQRLREVVREVKVLSLPQGRERLVRVRDDRGEVHRVHPSRLEWKGRTT